MANAVKVHDAPQTGSAIITPAEMIGQAITSNSGPEVMEKLMAMQERWDARNAKMAFDDAMAELRLNMPAVIKRQTVDFTTAKGRTNYKYEDLSDVTEALSPVMAPLGLSFRWRTNSGKDGVTVTCVIAHRQGHSEETTLTAGIDNSGNKNPIQAIGSAVTYLQRYTLKAAVGVAAAHDDDGQASGDRPTEKTARKDEEARSVFAKHQQALRLAKTKDELRDVWTLVDLDWNKLTPDWQSDLDAIRVERLHDIKIDQQRGKSPTNSLDDQFPGTIDPETQKSIDRFRV